MSSTERDNKQAASPDNREIGAGNHQNPSNATPQIQAGEENGAGQQQQQGQGTQRQHGSGSNRGFAGMDEARQRAIAAAGGRAAHKKGTAHEFTPEEARIAGRKGGEARAMNARKAAMNNERPQQQN